MEEFQTLLILMVVVWVMGKVFRAISLPVVFGELVGGIIVGPLLLNLVDPNSVTIKVLAELGIFFLMLHSGLETDPYKLLKTSRKSALIAIGGFVLPFILGYFTSRWFGQSVNESVFIAIGVSMTAIAVSVRVLKDYKMQNSEVANIILGTAILTDIMGLISLSVMLDIVEKGSVDIATISFFLIKIILFFAIVIAGGFLSARYFNKLFRNKGFTLTLIIAMALGLLAESMGLHMIIGAFLAGLFIREEVIDKKIFNKIEDRIYGLSYSFPGPIFFTSLAFYLDFTAVYARPGFLILIIVIAIVGKIIGSGVMAYFQKLNFKKSLLIGLAVNSRGAVELVIASIGLAQGIIQKDVFSILVIMAFVTTLISIIGMKPIAKYAH